MDEADEYVTVETVDDGVDQQNTPLHGSHFNEVQGVSLGAQALAFLTANGWFIIITLITIYFVWKQLIEPRLQKSGTSLSQSSATQFRNAEEVLARQEAMEAARRRLQEQYDLKAQEFAVKQKEKEEKLREQKLKELEKYAPGLGCTNKTKVPESSSGLESSLGKRKPEKSKLRPEYNPLMGGGSGGACFRPARRGAGGGG